MAAMRFAKTIEVPSDPETAFAYVADFANAHLWDPGVVASRRVDDGPIGVGSQFELVATFRGREQQFLYTVTAFEAPRRIELTGEGAKARSIDTVEFSPSASGTAIAYHAVIQLKGARRIAEPFLAGTFAKMGEDALAGLTRALTA
ncbi:MAG: hypothetical protein F2663_05505 [Actinobacteria bacterium]|uniref:Unannotated protein n=1 Tax=freshwater metagenome TaxID=449393 RepID=A0A6J6PKE4_9ZZZZ|nr:hypothetical protein [Actinomycetota bacterium]